MGLDVAEPTIRTRHHIRSIDEAQYQALVDEYISYAYWQGREVE